MFQIDPNTIYSLSDLDEKLAGQGLSARWLMDEVRPRKLARAAVLGSDLLDALREYTRQRREVAGPVRTSLPLPDRRRAGRPRKAEFEPLDRSKYEK